MRLKLPATGHYAKIRSFERGSKDHYLNNTYKLYDFKDEVEDHLYDKYIAFAIKHNWKNIEQSAFNRLLLRVPDRVEFSNEILKDFHGKEESEQIIILELLFLSGGDLPNENYYSNRYQFHLVSLIISMNWDRQEYLIFFTDHLKSDNQENAISCLIHSTKVNSALWDTDELLNMLINFISMDHPTKLRQKLAQLLWIVLRIPGKMSMSKK